MINWQNILFFRILRIFWPKKWGCPDVPDIPRNYTPVTESSTPAQVRCLHARCDLDKNNLQNKKLNTFMAFQLNYFSLWSERKVQVRGGCRPLSASGMNPLNFIG